MITVKIKGGLGNQMFQYAFGRTMSLWHDTPLSLDLSWFTQPQTYPFPYSLDNFKIVNSGLEPKGEVRKEKYPGFNGELLYPFPGDMIYEGYFQDEGYFKSCRNVLLEELALEMNSMNTDLLAHERVIQKQVSVFIHVRRGERTSGKAHELFGLVSKNFYDKSIKMMQRWFAEPRFFIFTDDFEWTTENLDYPANTIVFGEKDFPDYQCIYLMSKCDHAIIANSSFSWWGAWLMTNPHKIVIAPSKWTTDISISNQNIRPSGWIAMNPEYE